MLNVELKEVVRQFELTLAKSGEFNELKIVVVDDYDDGALLELQNEGYSIKLHFVVHKVWAGKRRVKKLHYICCYPRVVYGSRSELGDVNIFGFADDTTIYDACVNIVANSFAQRIDGIGEIENFEDVCNDTCAMDQD